MGGDAEAAHRLHHQQRVVAAGARPQVEGFDGGLHAHGFTRQIGKVVLDAFGHADQQAQGVRRAARRHESQRPEIDGAERIRIVPCDGRGEVGQFGVEIVEGQALGIGLYLERGRVVGIAFDDDLALKTQLGAHFAEFRDGDRITERIVYPAERGRRHDAEFGGNQPQIVAVARPHHQPVLAERHRLRVGVGGSVIDPQAGHFQGFQVVRPELPKAPRIGKQPPS